AAPLSLGARRRVQGAHLERRRRRAPAGGQATGCEHDEDGEHGGRSAQANAHQITTRRLARTWVAAGAAHEPLAQRCHDSTRPAARSIGSTQNPYTLTCTRANNRAEPPTARATPPGRRAS